MYCLFLLKKIISLVVGSIWWNLLLWLWGVKTNGFIKCFGIPQIQRSPKGIIKLGRGIVLRSSYVSNIAGISHKVQIGTINNGFISIGNGCGLSGTTIVSSSRIILEDNVWLGVNCRVYDCDFHPINFESRINGKEGKSSPVTLKRGVWLGADVLVLKGVTIGEETVVGAGSVVTHSLPAHVLAAGNPAKIIKEL